jgi:epsilon-lactone hydrolase
MADVPKPSFQDDGSVGVPAFELPPSPFVSEEARAAMAMRAKMPGGAPPATGDIHAIRAGLEEMMKPQVERMHALYPVDVADGEIAGVRVRTITPKGQEPDPDRVLINLHGGAFCMCADACGLLESLPLSSLGGMTVVAVDYRMAPEHAHPAAIEDVAAVYGALLDRYQPGRIGIFGCSAGGALTGQAAAWLPAHGLPQCGAIGIFGAGASYFGRGDSAYIAGYIDGSFPPPAPRGQPKNAPLDRGYFAGADLQGPEVSPAFHPDVLAKFPPALIITGTRAMDMSPAIVTNSALIKAGVPSTLIVGEGMGHCYIYQSDLPESRDAHRAIVDFFQARLS